MRLRQGLSLIRKEKREGWLSCFLSIPKRALGLFFCAGRGPWGRGEISIIPHRRTFCQEIFCTNFKPNFPIILVIFPVLQFIKNFAIIYLQGKGKGAESQDG
jgi:hypothetical protein